MTDHYLKFANEAEATAVLYTTHPEVKTEDGDVITLSYIVPNYQNIDTIGIIYEQTPEDAGEDYEPVALEGWHVNVRPLANENVTSLVDFFVNPKRPRRVWA
jgi:hypothetical protein